jgi:hypothetical protein
VETHLVGDELLLAVLKQPVEQPLGLLDTHFIVSECHILSALSRTLINMNSNHTQTELTPSSTSPRSRAACPVAAGTR